MKYGLVATVLFLFLATLNLLYATVPEGCQAPADGLYSMVIDQDVVIPGHIEQLEQSITWFLVSEPANFADESDGLGFVNAAAADNHYESTFDRDLKGRPFSVMKCPTMCEDDFSRAALTGMESDDLIGMEKPIATRCRRPGYSVLKCPYIIIDEASWDSHDNLFGRVNHYMPARTGQNAIFKRSTLSVLKYPYSAEAILI